MPKISAPCHTKGIPLPILTSAENLRQIKQEYGWNAFIAKSVDAAAFIAAVQENLL
jgi:hypothetical protein